jgi:hypothetical protein
VPAVAERTELYKLEADVTNAELEFQQAEGQVTGHETLGRRWCRRDLQGLLRS